MIASSLEDYTILLFVMQSDKKLRFLLRYIPTPSNRSRLTIPCIGSKIKNASCFSFMIPLVTNSMVGTPSSMACIRTQGQTELVSLYNSPNTRDQTTVITHPQNTSIIPRQYFLRSSFPPKQVIEEEKYPMYMS